MDAAPPLPRSLPRVDPGHVIQTAFGGQALGQVVLQEVYIAVGDGQDTPGECPGSLRLGDIAGPPDRNGIPAPPAIFQRIRCELASQALPVGRVDLEEHAGIILRSGLHDGDFLPAEIDDIGDDGQGVIDHPGHWNLGIVGLEGIAVALPSPVVVHIGDERAVVLVETEVHAFVLHGHPTFAGRDEPIGCAGIVCAVLHAVVSGHLEDQSVVAVMDFRFMIDRSREGHVDRSCLRRLHPR